MKGFWLLFAAMIAMAPAAGCGQDAASLLGAALAFRPRRRGTPARSAPVIQTQIILAIMGALVMLVVGATRARLEWLESQA